MTFASCTIVRVGNRSGLSSGKAESSVISRINISVIVRGKNSLARGFIENFKSCSQDNKKSALL